MQSQYRALHYSDMLGRTVPSTDCSNREGPITDGGQPWTYFTNGPNSVASISPILIYQCLYVCAYVYYVDRRKSMRFTVLSWSVTSSTKLCATIHSRTRKHIAHRGALLSSLQVRPQDKYYYYYYYYYYIIYWKEKLRAKRQKVIFRPNVIKIDPYNFELYHFKVGTFSRHGV